MLHRNLIAIGASAGGVEILKQLTELLPANLPAAVLVVIHVPSDSPSLLAQILAKHCKLPVTEALDGQPIQTGHIYVARPNHHLLVKDGYLELSQGPKENRHRPAIDPLFRSVSRYCGPQAIGIVLSGMLDDGSSGLVTIKRRGGVGIAQDPKEAPFASMPLSAIENGVVDYVVSVSEMASLLVRLTSEPIEEKTSKPQSSQPEKESEISMEGDRPAHPGSTGGRLLPITCPDCGGTLWEKRDGKSSHFKCHVGHAYSPQSLVEGNSEALEEALWMALRILQERITICRDLALVPRPGGNATADHFNHEAAEAETRAALLRSVLHGKSFENKTSPVAAPDSIAETNSSLAR